MWQYFSPTVNVAGQTESHPRGEGKRLGRAGSVLEILWRPQGRETTGKERHSSNRHLEPTLETPEKIKLDRCH